MIAAGKAKTDHKTVTPGLCALRIGLVAQQEEADMSVHQVVSTAQAQTPDRSRETIRERWRMTLLSARERDECAENAMLVACANKASFVRLKPRMLRSNAWCE